MLTVLLGGARSGKSTLALELARRSDSPVTYLATCPRLDGDVDLAARIERHRAERPSSWVTIEEELDLGAAIDAVSTGTLVIDCLTTWVGNVLVHGRSADEIEVAAEVALEAVGRRGGDTIVVSNEVGSGIIPADELSRTYRDALGRVNQRWVARSDRALLVVAGRALLLRDAADLS